MNPLSPVDSEKQLLVPSGTNLASSSPPRTSLPRLFAFRLLLTFVLFRLLTSSHVYPHLEHSLRRFTGHRSGGTSESTCPQVGALAPPSHAGLDSNKDVVFSAGYREKSAAVHSGLVKVRSESFDDLGEVGKDPRWDVFYGVESYLKAAFPLVHSKLALTKVNTHGLLYTWQGSDPSLKPSMLMAHQDTVPVNSETLNDWTYHPWSGHYDGKFLWGRGSADCKNTLSGTLEAVTLLLEQGFQPRRTILLSYGFDEESKGWEGAGRISEHLESVYGEDGIAFILDEGGLGIGEMYGSAFALPATGEKGYLDVNITLHTPGGHSSIPPLHTGIGILSALITSLESTPYSPSLSLASPIFSLLQCAATHGDLSHELRENVRRGAGKGRKAEEARMEAARRFAEVGRAQRYLVSTSQAVDVMGGGVKVNALPETTFAVVNHRIAVDSSASVIKEKLTEHAVALAKAHNLDLDAFGKKISVRSDEAISGGQLKLVGINELEPAPVSPTSTKEWQVLSASIKHAFADRYDSLLVSPCVMTGNTDTRFMWALTKNIYRFTPMDRGVSTGIHTVDEHLLFDDHISGIWFFHELLRSADAAEF